MFFKILFDSHLLTKLDKIEGQQFRHRNIVKKKGHISETEEADRKAGILNVHQIHRYQHHGRQHQIEIDHLAKPHEKRRKPLNKPLENRIDSSEQQIQKRRKFVGKKK